MNDKKGLAKHCEYLESKIRKKQFKIDELQSQLKQRDEVIDKLITNWNALEKYIDKNKMILNNPDILQFYMVQREILQRYRGDNK